LTADYQYAGTELELFAHARNWKAYWSSMIGPFVGDNVLDVGAGLGATASALSGRSYARWTALEPDPQLADRLRVALVDKSLPSYVDVRCGTTESIAAEEKYDTVLYVDVLEHIEDDAAELQRASQHLLPGGRLIIVAPAHKWLYTPFDRAIGHCRRYNRKDLDLIRPAVLSTVLFRYIDSVGMLASLANKLILKTAHATQAQISVWDRCLVPMSRVVDPVLAGRVGKSIICVYSA